MGKADGLSSRPDWEVGVEKDNEEQTLVKKEWLEARVAQVSEVVIEGVNVLDKIRKSETKDDKVIKAVEEMKQAGVKVLRDKEWREYKRLMSGPVRQSRIPLREYEVKTRRTRQSSLYESTSYLYLYMWL